MNTNEIKQNNIKGLLPNLFKAGLRINIGEEYFKDYVNIFFRNEKTIAKILKLWESPSEPLQLKFDDRLNMFFLYDAYQPVLGFYHYNESIQLVPFSSNSLLLGAALLIEFAETMNDTERAKELFKTKRKKK